MSGNVGDIIIDRYVDEFARALRGPRRLRAELVREARDGLLDAKDSYVDAGLTPGEAAERAVREFGRPEQVLPAYRVELAAAQGRRAALWVALVLPAMTLLAPLMWWNSPWNTESAGHGYWVLTDHYEYISALAAAIAAVELLGFGWGSRFVADTVRYTRWVGLGALTFLLPHGALGATVVGFSIYQWPLAATWPPVLLGLALNALAFGYALLLAWRCVTVTRWPGSAPAATRC